MQKFRTVYSPPDDSPFIHNRQEYNLCAGMKSLIVYFRSPASSFLGLTMFLGIFI
jgi:hypothetical protein